MRIAGVGTRPGPSEDVASALSGAAALLGQRPAITSLQPDGRHEQGFVSLAGWVAKGAHLLRDEHDLGAGDRLGIAAPPGWPLAAVVLAAWWLGVVVVPATTPGLRLRVLHVGTAQDVLDLVASEHPAGEVLWLGDALDGTGTPPLPHGESWTDAVIPHPDRAPAAAHGGTLPALLPGDGPELTQRELLAWCAADPGGPLGIVRHGDTDVVARRDGGERLAALVLRPLVTGAASVVVPSDGPDHEGVAVAERIVRWLA